MFRTVTFDGHVDERVYGLGEHKTGTVNQMPYFKLFQTSQWYPVSHGGDVSIPLYTSSIGYAFVWNSPSYGFVNLTTDALTWYSNATMNVDFWIATTPAPASTASSTRTSPFAALLSSAMGVLGHAPAMPWYATGFIQCKDRYRNQSQLLDVARGYVDRGLPISTIVIDWHHWENMGDWTFKPQCWPDPQAMVDELHTLGESGGGSPLSGVAAALSV